MIFKFLVELVQSGGGCLSKGLEFGVKFGLEFLEDMIVMGDWCRGGSFETGNVVLQFRLCLERSSKCVMHFFVFQFRVLKCFDEVCNFVNVVTLRAGGIQSAR